MHGIFLGFKCRSCRCLNPLGEGSAPMMCSSLMSHQGNPDNIEVSSLHFGLNGLGFRVQGQKPRIIETTQAFLVVNGLKLVPRIVSVWILDSGMWV